MVKLNWTFFNLCFSRTSHWSTGAI